jgi:hypothetical protein
MTQDEEPIVRGHATWALGQLAARRVAPLPSQALVEALGRERNALVQGEIRAVLAV